MPSLLVVSGLCTALFMLARRTAAHSPLRDRGPLFNNSLVVQSLDVAGYESMINDTNVVWLVDYYSSWCAHCRMFAPEWEKVGKFYAESSTVHVGAVDCNQHKGICVRAGVHAYPAARAHHVPLGGEDVVEMGIKGRKKVESVVEWVEEMLEQHNIESGVNMSTLLENKKLLRNEPDEEAAATVSGVVEEISRDKSEDMKLRRLRDAGKAAVLTLENSLFMGASILDGERYDAALMWVDALANTFPVEGNRLSFAALADDMKQQTHWKLDEWS